MADNPFLLTGIPIGVGITLFAAFTDASFNGVGVIGGIAVAAISGFAYLQFGSGASGTRSGGEDEKADADAKEVVATQKDIEEDQNENEERDSSIEQVIASDGGTANLPANIQNSGLPAIIEKQAEESEEIKQDAEKVNEIQNKVDQLLNEENQLKKKLQKMSGFGDTGDPLEDHIEAGDVETVVAKLNHLDRGENLALEDLQEQAKDLKKVIELEEESKQLVENQIEHLENQLQYEEEALEKLKAESGAGKAVEDDTVGHMVMECENTIGLTKRDIEKSKKVLEEIEEIEALEQDHEQKVEGILKMEQS